MTTEREIDPSTGYFLPDVSPGETTASILARIEVLRNIVPDDFFTDDEVANEILSLVTQLEERYPLF